MVLREHEKENAYRTIETAQAVHAAAAPLVAKDGAKLFNNFIESLRNFISPKKPVDPLRAIKDRVKKRNAAKASAHEHRTS